MPKKKTKLQIVILSLIVIFSILSIITIYFYSIRDNTINPPTKICIPGEKRCSGNKLESCDANGLNYYQVDYCDYGCQNKQCLEDNTCYPKTCTTLGKVCGNWDNGCGNNVLCGNCINNQVCSSGQCLTQCVPDTCYDIGKTCDIHSNGCGGYINCGSCSSGYKCNNGRCELIYVSAYPVFSVSYDTARKNAGISDDYLKETWYYDYSNIYASKDPNYIINLKKFPVKDVVKAIAQETYNKINYDLDYQTGDYCYNSRASDIMRTGKGVCSTMSRVNIALLRGLGIASRAVTGCVKSTTYCKALSIFNPENIPKLSPPKKEGKKWVTGGVLHSWVEVWLPDTGWTILESTNGHLYSNSCVDYDKYASEKEFISDIDECTMDNYYALKCKLF